MSTSVPGDMLVKSSYPRQSAIDSKRRAAEAFYSALQEAGAELLEPEYINSTLRHSIRCKKGHEVKCSPNAVQQGHSICNACSGRNSKHKIAGYSTIIRVFENLPEGKALHIENHIKDTFKLAGVLPVKGNEYFSGDHIKLVIDILDNSLGEVV
jgi:hypothetical protein